MAAGGALGTILGGFGGGVIGGAVVSLGLDDSNYRKSLAATEASNAKGASSLGTLWKAGATAAAAAVIGFGASAVRSFEESEAVAAQTAAAIQSTGGAAGMTADEISNLAAKFQGLTTYSDEEVQSAENLLLTFTNIGEQAFPDATAAVLDMSTALGQDLKSSSIQLGKALNDPIKGITSLQRVGVAFDEDTRKHIETLVSQNKLYEAQRIILDEISKEFGGSAQAAANTFAGKMKQLANEFDNFKESVGKVIVEALTWLLDNLPQLIRLAIAFGAAWVAVNWAQIATAISNVILLLRQIPGLATAATVSLEALPASALGFLVPGIGGVKDLSDSIGDLGRVVDDLRSKGVDLQHVMQILNAEGLKPNAEAVKLAYEKNLSYADALEQVTGATDDAGAATKQTGREITRFAGMTSKGLNQWKQSAKESFDSFALSLSDTQEDTKITRKTFMAATHAMLQNARELSRAMIGISKEKWVPAEYVQFLSDQGPEWLIGFGQLTEDQQHRAVRAWERGRDATDKAKGALDKAFNALKDLNGTSRYTVFVDYVVNGQVPPGVQGATGTAPGARTPGRSGAQGGGATPGGTHGGRTP